MGVPAADQDQDGREPGPWEWAVAATGFVVVAGVLAFLAWQAWRFDDSPPDPVLSVERIVVQPGPRYLVVVRAENRGSRAAASLRIAGRLIAQGAAVERSRTEFDYLPGRSQREAGLFFAHDPRGLDFALTVESYQRP